MHIYLLRHGIAEDAGPTVAEPDRALTEEGWKRLRRAALAWRSLVVTPDVIMVSPLRRAQETAQVFAEAVRFRGELRTDNSLIPSAPASLALSLIEVEALSQTKGVAVIGHEPNLGYLLGTLITGHPRLPIPLKKGMLVGVDTESTTGLVASLRFALSSKAAADLT
jgi:phosphohistidine phosphatase